MSSVGGTSAGFDRYAPGDEEWYMRDIAAGGPIEDWMRDYFPSKLTVDPKSKCDDFIITAGGISFCSKKVKQLIEQLEPDIHQFWPVDLYHGDELKEYFMLRFGQAADCFDLERSNIRWKETPPNPMGQKKNIG